MMREPNKSEVSLLTEDNRGMCRKEIDSRWSWLVCVCATVMIALMFGISLNFGFLFPVLMDYFQESRERTGNFTEETINNFLCVMTQCSHSWMFFQQSFMCVFLGENFVMLVFDLSE